MRVTCVCCGKKTSRGKVIRVGPERIGPFCDRCVETVSAQVRREGIAVKRGGRVPDGAVLSDPLRGTPPLADIAFLWDLPEEDFPAWSEMKEYEEGVPAAGFTYADYRRNIMEAKAAVEREGVPVCFVRVSFRELKDACREAGVPWDARGRMIALRNLGMKLLDDLSAL